MLVFYRLRLRFGISKNIFTKYNVQSQKRILKSRVINKYWHWYPWFWYLRKICYYQGRFQLAQRKSRLNVSIFFFCSNFFCTDLIAEIRLLCDLSHQFTNFMVVLSCVEFQITVWHAIGKKSLPDSLSQKCDHWLSIILMNINKIQAL